MTQITNYQMQIQNQESEAIESINISEDLEYSNPFIMFDTLKPKIKNKDIKVIVYPYDLKELRSLGIYIYSIKVKKGKTWNPRQKIRYYMRYSDLPADSGSKEIIKLPANHMLENDIANNRIRLIGRFISADTNKTEWFNY